MTSPSATSQPLDKFLEARNKALRDLDLDFCRNQCGYPMTDEVALITLHKARYECKDIEDELRLASRHWLEEHGYKRLGGMAFPKDKLELPE